MVKQKKTMKMKKIYIGLTLAMMIVALLALSFAGCGPKADYKIGAIQVAPHPALDSAYNGFKDELTELMAGKGQTVNFTIENAYGEFSNNSTIANKYVSQNVDMIYALGTPSAQAAKNATSTIPILFNAVTDPVDPATKLLTNAKKPEGNVTGCSDAAPINQQLDLLVKLSPQTEEVIAVVYNKDEPNSAIQANQVKAYCEDKGYKFEYQTVSGNITDLEQCFIKLKQLGATGIYLPTDNLLAENIKTVKNFNEAHTRVPIVCGESGMTEGCGVATIGLDYYELGKMAAKMAFDYLENGKKIEELPVLTQTENFAKVIFKDNADGIGLTIPEDVLAEFE